eukprot:13801896-Alexandrium_andersonii.AAC.1
MSASLVGSEMCIRDRAKSGLASLAWISCFGPGYSASQREIAKQAREEDMQGYSVRDLRWGAETTLGFFEEGLLASDTCRSK